VNAVICVLVEVPLIRLTANRHPARVMAIGMALQGVGVGLTVVATDRMSLLLTVILWSMAETIYSPVAQAYPGMISADHLRGRYQGAEGLAMTVGQTAGPALGSYLYVANQVAHWVVCGVLGFVAAGIILAAGDPRLRRLDSDHEDAAALTAARPS